MSKQDKNFIKYAIVPTAIFFSLFFMYINKPQIEANESIHYEEPTEEQKEQLQKESFEEQEQAQAEKEAQEQIYFYNTVNMLPNQYEGGDEEIYNKCTYEINCVFLPPDDENFEQFDTIIIDGVEYVVIEKTSNCNNYYNENGTYERATACVEFWDNEKYNKKEVEMKGVE